MFTKRILRKITEEPDGTAVGAITGRLNGRKKTRPTKNANFIKQKNKAMASAGGRTAVPAKKTARHIRSS